METAPNTAMYVLFSDFGLSDPYVGQVKAVLHAHAPGVPVIDLMHAVPDFNAHAGAHLLDALKTHFPRGSIFLCVVDPGVGSDRQAIVLEADGRVYLAPDNGLLSVVMSRAAKARHWRIDWRPESASSTFHGRDVFAPMAARIAMEGLPCAGLAATTDHVEFDAADLPRLIYLDHYGNAWTGLRAANITPGEIIFVKGQSLPRRGAFHEAGKGEVFWYENSCGLVEIAANRASAVKLLGLRIGDPIKLQGSPDNRLH